MNHTKDRKALFQMTTPDQDLLKAYLETDYFVRTDPVFTLRIGQQCSQIIKLHKQYRVECSAFITAFNPYSESCSLNENRSRQELLTSELKVRSLKFVEGIGKHPSNSWPCEPSLLIFGLSLEAAKMLGVRFEQNAILWIGKDAIPELVLLT